MENQLVAIDTLWVLVCAFLVFFMNTGFGCLEAGFCRAKNTVNILAKNFVVFGISSLAFWAIGFGLMFGDGNSLIGTNGWFLTGLDNSPLTGDAYQGVFSSLNWAAIPLEVKFFFQLAFAATAATIVSGCVAERIHYSSFIIFALLVVGVFYPISGHWIWGGGWLAGLGMWDFAGSTVVHSVGGWAGLAGIIVLGPRIGKYRKNGSVSPIPGHSMPLAFLGGMILWLGWFGFNPGSTMGISGDNTLAVSHIVVTTNIACAAGLLCATFCSWLITRKPDFSLTVNGALAGLVAVTAPCAFVGPFSALAIGLVAGALVVGASYFFDKIRIDDPVGALSVHLVCGVWGTLAVGLFASTDAPGGIDSNGLFMGGGFALLGAQAIGVLAVGAFTFSLSLLSWLALKYTLSIRVIPQVEVEGLDAHEMGSEAYPKERAIESKYELPKLIEVSQLGAHEREISKSVPTPEVDERFLSKSLPYELILQSIDRTEFLNQWRKYCGNKNMRSQEFRSLYRNFTTIDGFRLRFRGGNPVEMRDSLVRLAREINPSAQVQIETLRPTEFPQVA